MKGFQPFFRTGNVGNKDERKLFAPIIGKTVSGYQKGNLTEEEWSKLYEYIDRIKKMTIYTFQTKAVLIL